MSFSFLLFFSSCVVKHTNARRLWNTRQSKKSTQIFSRREKIWFLRLKTARGQASASTRVTVRIRSRECSISIRRFSIRTGYANARARADAHFFRLFRLKIYKRGKTFEKRPKSAHRGYPCRLCDVEKTPEPFEFGRDCIPSCFLA